MIKKKNTIIKEDDGFRVRVESWECLAPKGLYNLDFIQESLKNGEVTNSSTYNFFMTKNELKKLSESLNNV